MCEPEKPKKIYLLCPDVKSPNEYRKILENLIKEGKLQIIFPDKET